MGTVVFSAPAAKFPIWDVTAATGREAGRAARERGLAAIDRGALAEADSLLGVADSAGLLSAAEYLRWIEAKAVLSKYEDAARLCCKIDALEPRFGALARGRLMQMIEEQPLAAKRAALASYRRCALSDPFGDTLRIKRWLSSAYASAGLFDQQDSLLVELDTRKFPSAMDFLEAAAGRFSRGFVSEAIFPAANAYTRLTDPAARSLAATILFQWYRQALMPDSAAYWLSRASLADERFRISAIAFLQSAGMLDRADSLMAALRPSFARDTLMLRRLLYAGDAKAAYARAGSVLRALRAPKAPEDAAAAAVWKARTALFSDNAADLDGWIDTVSFSPSSPAGEEILSYRYRLTVLASAPAPGAVRDFCVIAYALWRGKPEAAAAARLSASAYPREVRETLACDIVKAFCNAKRFGDARAAAEAVGLDSAGPELRYYYADACIQQGHLDQGTAMLERLMLAGPDNVFSGRARALLKSLKKKKQ